MPMWLLLCSHGADRYMHSVFCGVPSLLQENAKLQARVEALEVEELFGTSPSPSPSWKRKRDDEHQGDDDAADAPAEAPTGAPAEAPTEAPTASPTEAPADR